MTSLVGLVGMGLSVLVLGLAPSWALYIALAGALAMGVTNVFTNGPLFAILQSTVDPDMQARVLSLLATASGAMSPLGLLIAGPTVDRVGIRTWFLVGGLACLLMGLAGPLIPAIMRIEEPRSGTISAPAPQ